MGKREYSIVFFLRYLMEKLVNGARLWSLFYPLQGEIVSPEQHTRTHTGPLSLSLSIYYLCLHPLSYLKHLPMPRDYK